MRKVLIAAALIAAAPALAQTSSTTVTTTTRTQETGSVTFSPAQETTIRRYVTRERTRPVTVRERVVVGGTIPTEVELAPIPDEIVTEIPTVRSYRYFSTDAGIAIVDPGSRRVVRVIERQ